MSLTKSQIIRNKKEAAWKKAVNAKTRVCKACKKRKNIDAYYHVKPPRIPKFKPDRMTQCKKCQNKQSKAAYLRRTTKAQRQVYMRDYMREYNKLAA